MREVTVCLTGDIDTGEESLDKDLLPLVEVLSSHNVPMTFPVTAVAVVNHHLKIEMLKAAGHEIAGHGDVHQAFRDPFDVQVRRLESMSETFETYLGARPRGFRAPFLQHNRDTYRAVSRAGLLYDSSRVCRDPIVTTKALLGKGHAYRVRVRSIPRVWLNSLRTQSSSNPFLVSENVVELPVLDLDDWFFYDAEVGPRLLPEDWRVVTEHWTSALHHLMRLGANLLVLQSHPGRLQRGLLKAVDEFIARAKSARCTFRTMSDVQDRCRRNPDWLSKNRTPPRWALGPTAG